MNASLVIVVLILFTLGVASLLLNRRECRSAAVRVLCGWLVLLPLLALVNIELPFAGGGDDEDYFRLATRYVRSWQSVFDLQHDYSSMAQPGYPFLLSVVNLLADGSLFALKAMNVALFLTLVPIWQRIGLELGSREFARRLSTAVLFLTPLWFYSFFLLKDVVVTVLQSLFLLGIVQLSQRRGLGPWLLVVAATAMTVLFRSPLVLVNLAVVVGVVTVALLRQGTAWSKIVGLTLAVIVVGSLGLLTTNHVWLASLGVHSAERVVGSAAMIESVKETGGSSLVNRAHFPLLYLFRETAGMNPQTWSTIDSAWLRGVLAIPWIILGVPFFVVGIGRLLLGKHEAKSSQLQHCSNGQDNAVAGDWSGILFFLMVYFALSWQVGDTTRWRLPDMPAMAAVALTGWLHGTPRSRYVLLQSWVIGIGVSFGVYYLWRAV